MEKMLVLLALGLGMLGHGSARAGDQVIHVPFGPGAQGVALEWVKGLPMGGEHQVSIRDIQVEPFEVRYVVSTSTRNDAGTVKVSFDSTAKEVVVTSKTEVSDATAFVQLLSRRLKEVTAPEALQVTWSKPEQKAEIQETEARGPPWWRSVEEFLVWMLLGSLLAGLLLSGPLLLRSVRAVERRDWLMLGTLQLLLAVALWLGDDTVLYHSGHGWAMAELIHQASTSDPHAGALAPLWSHLLGWPASGGQEAFLASRVGTLLSVFLLWCWLFFMTGQRWFAWIATLILSVQPALFLAGRSEYVATPGLALVLLTLVLVTLAGRDRHWKLIFAATAALGLVASFRALGPVVWPFCGVFFFVAKPVEPSKGLKITLIAGLLVALFAIPSFLRVLGVGTTYMPSEGLSLLPDFGQTQLLGDVTWTGPLLGVFALGAGVPWLARSGWEGPYRSRVAALGMFGMVWSIVYATQHVAGTYLNTPRYHLWLLVPAATAIGSLASLVMERSRRTEIALLVVALLVLVVGLFQPWSTSLERHPEARQLDAWRAAATLLPQDATLYVPSRRGEHEIKLPISELSLSRPDVVVKRGSPPRESGSFAFKPLDCLRPSLSPGPSTRDDCRSFESGWSPVDGATRGTSWMVSSEDGNGEIEASLDADYWVYPALSDPPGPVGLFTR